MNLKGLTYFLFYERGVLHLTVCCLCNGLVEFAIPVFAIPPANIYFKRVFSHFSL